MHLGKASAAIPIRDTCAI